MEAYRPQARGKKLNHPQYPGGSKELWKNASPGVDTLELRDMKLLESLNENMQSIFLINLALIPAGESL